MAAGASAEALARGKKAGDVSGTFSYRVVAKRKDVKGERLAKVPLPPDVKPPTAFAVPEAPSTKPPETRKT